MFRLILLLLALCLAACSQVPPLARPDAPVPPRWPDAVDTVGTRDAAKTHWRNFFTDPRLQALIQTALDNNRDLRIAAARVQEARAQYGIARAERLPTLNLLGKATYERTPEDLNTSGQPLNNERYDLTLSSISYEVDFWGRIAGLSQAARTTYLATEEARRTVHLSLVADVANAYLSLLQLDEMTTLARAAVASREESLALITKGRDLGAAYDLELESARALLESARGNLAALDHQRLAAMHQLNYLVGSQPGALPPGKRLEEQEVDNDLAPGLPSEVLLLRPDVMAAEHRLAAAHANIHAARAAFFPKVLLTAGLGVAGGGLGTLFASRAWLFQPVLSLPIFDGGRTEAGLDIAQARKTIAVAEYEKTIQQAFREVADQLSSRAALAAQMRASLANRRALERRLEITRARFNTGLIGYLDVLESERDLVAAQQANAQVRRAQLEAAALLYKALGGGAPPATALAAADAAKP
jgi:outer membrane protein, multidrug efflux system